MARVFSHLDWRIFAGKLDLGVFVKDVIAGGPAERSGQVHAGDRIIAINGQSLEGMAHHQAVELIRQSPNKVCHLSSTASLKKDTKT